LAICELDAGASNKAEALARNLIADPQVLEDVRASAGVTLGEALNSQGRIDEAFAAYTEANAITRRLNAPRFERPGQETYPQFLARLSDWFSRLPPADWRPAGGEEASPAAGHVFVMGFARSGTTLLETTLASHPAVTGLDEGDAMRVALKEAMSSNEALGKLAKLDVETARRWRDGYWKRIAELDVDVRGKVFVDKAPLASTMLPLINALFPSAKILFVLRDPRDVVLSCFRRAFGVNHSTYEFTTLAGTAHCYDDQMRLTALYRERLSLDLREVRYEQLAGDFETEAKAICDFLCLEWNGEMAEFAETARARPSRTPSARQLVRGLYSGDGQWRPYVRHLEPILPILAPWIERYGYAEA
jgi:hypothetical protein